MSALSDSRYFQLYLAARRQAWDPTAIDLGRDPGDWAVIRRDHARAQFAEQIHRVCALFYEGEQSVAETLAPFLSAIGRAGLGLDKELFLISQIHDEARHYEFFARYVGEVLGDADTRRHLAPEPRALLIDDLQEIGQRLNRESDPAALTILLVEGVTRYMGLVEALLARTGYRGVQEALSARGWLPGLQEGFRLIRRDEGRHVAFGITFLRECLQADPALAQVVLDTFDRGFPGVVGTVRLFDFPEPLVSVDALVEYAIGAHRQFLSATGLLDEPLDSAELEADLAG